MHEPALAGIKVFGSPAVSKAKGLYFDFSRAQHLFFKKGRKYGVVHLYTNLRQQELKFLGLTFFSK